MARGSAGRKAESQAPVSSQQQLKHTEQAERHEKHHGGNRVGGEGEKTEQGVCERREKGYWKVLVDTGGALLSKYPQPPLGLAARLTAV